MIDAAELDEARTFLMTFSAPQLGQIARLLWPAAAVGRAGPLSLVALDLIGEALADRERLAA